MGIKEPAQWIDAIMISYKHSEQQMRENQRLKRELRLKEDNLNKLMDFTGRYFEIGVKGRWGPGPIYIDRPVNDYEVYVMGASRRGCVHVLVTVEAGAFFVRGTIEKNFEHQKYIDIEKICIGRDVQSLYAYLNRATRFLGGNDTPFNRPGPRRPGG